MSQTAPAALVASLDAQAQALAQGDARVAQVRASSRAAAAAHGLPTTRQERWKYTALRALGARTFLAPEGVAHVDAAAIAHIPAPRFVIVNGRYDPALSRAEDLPEGLRVRLFSELLRDTPEEAAALLLQDTQRADEALLQWNAALATEGFVIDVANGVDVTPTIHLVVIGAEDGNDRAFHLRHHLALAEGATLHVVEHQVGVGTHRHLQNTVGSVALAEGATLTHSRAQQEASGASLVQCTQAALGKDSSYRRVDLELGGALSRHELNVVLHGDGAALEANGVLLADGRRHVDTRLGIAHQGLNTRCDLVWRGFGADRGRAVFHGGILIEKGADGTAAALSNKNLLVSDSAEIDTQPVLVIHADDVQAAHGATVGRLNDQALFYLRARGVPKAEATDMLTAAFLREPLAVVTDLALREQLETLLDTRLSAGAVA